MGLNLLDVNVCYEVILTIRVLAGTGNKMKTNGAEQSLEPEPYMCGNLI